MRTKKEGAQHGTPNNTNNLNVTQNQLTVKGDGAMHFCFRDTDVRMVTIDGAPWWVGKDVCGVLGFKNLNDAITDHCKGVEKRYPLPTPGGVQNLRIINEPDLFRLITHSRLPSAEHFERLVFEEILPQIHRTGMYLPPERQKAAAALEHERSFFKGLGRFMYANYHTHQSARTYVDFWMDQAEGLQTKARSEHLGLSRRTVRRYKARVPSRMSGIFHTEADALKRLMEAPHG